MHLTFKYRLKDKHASNLAAQARAVNLVWNYCNETQQKAVLAGRKWLSGYDLMTLTTGSTKAGLDLHSHTVQRVCRAFDEARRKYNKPWLRWRGQKSLGWVPFNTGHIALRNRAFVFRGDRYYVWLHRALPDGAKICSGSFNQDANGHWYINCTVKVKTATITSINKVGIDLGLSSLATLSTGEKIEAPQFYRKSEIALATAQRARKTKRTRAIHAKARNRRKDHLHKTSKKIITEYGLIIVGDVSPSGVAKSQFAKSVLDAGWADLKQLLSYKALMHGGRMLEVCERNTSRSCSRCGIISHAWPKGIAGLRNRVFECDACGLVMDRDHNAALNIRRIGQDALVGGVHV